MIKVKKAAILEKNNKIAAIRGHFWRGTGP